MSKRLYLSLTFSNFLVIKTLSSNHRMYNLYTKFVKILEICKQFSENLVNESGYRELLHAVVLFLSFRFGSAGTISGNRDREHEREKWLFYYKLQEYKDRIPNLISYDLSKANVVDHH